MSLRVRNFGPFADLDVVPIIQVGDVEQQWVDLAGRPHVDLAARVHLVRAAGAGLMAR